MTAGRVRSTREIVDHILEGYCQGHCRFEPTVELLHTYFRGLSSAEQERMFERLWERFLRSFREARKPSRVGDLQPDICPVVIRACAVFGPTGQVPFHVFGPLDTSSDAVLELWADRVYIQLNYSLFHYEHRFTQPTLEKIKACCADVVSGRLAPGSAVVSDGDADPESLGLPKTLIDAAKDLARTIDNVEFKRFARTLEQQDEQVEGKEDELLILVGDLGIDSAIPAALKQAEMHLRGTGPFDPKSAADLLRTSIDAAHREIVKTLARRTERLYEGRDSDGDRRKYMRDVEFISEAEEKFFSAIYTLISQEATHRLVAPKETVLVMQRTVSDYLRLLLRRLSDWRANLGT